ncbi:MAG: hypothetical protein AB1571_03325 [Nanoarchaeota archaeon]
MKIQTLKDYNDIIEILKKDVLSNKKLILKLESSSTWQERWVKLEDYIVEKLPKYDIPYEEFQYLNSGVNVKDRFFYEMQQTTKLDFGFCKFFKPSYTERAEYFLNDQKPDPSKNWDLCYLNKKPVWTLCVGTDRDICGFLNPELKKKKKRYISKLI